MLVYIIVHCMNGIETPYPFRSLDSAWDCVKEILIEQSDFPSRAMIFHKMGEIAELGAISFTYDGDPCSISFHEMELE